MSVRLGTGSDVKHRALTVPASLIPAWWHVPGLAWLAATGLSGRVGKVRGLRHVAYAAAFPAMLLGLAGSRAEHRLAAYQRRAVVAIRPLEPRRSTADRLRRLAVQLGGFVLATFAYAVVFLAFVVVAALVGVPVDVGLAAAFVAIVAFALLGVVATSRPLRMISGTRVLRRAVASARHTGTPLLEAVMLAAAPDSRRAATVLALHLRGHAEQHQVMVLARASSAEVARAYANLGFRPVDGHPGVLLRPHKARGTPSGQPIPEVAANTGDTYNNPRIHSPGKACGSVSRGGRVTPFRAEVIELCAVDTAGRCGFANSGQANPERLTLP